MPHACIEDKITETLTRKPWYRQLFFAFTGRFDLKNWIIKREFKRWVRKKKPAQPKVLDVGFGLGQHVYMVSKSLPNAHVLGLDVSAKAVACVNRYFNHLKHPHIYCKCKDIIEFEGNQSFDLVMAFKLLNYIEDDKQAIKRMFQALKPGGTLLILNSYSAQFQDTILEDPVHSLPLFRAGYTMESLRDMLKEAGFSTVKCRYIYGPSGQLAWKLGIGWPLKWLNKSYLLLPIVALYTLLIWPLVWILNYYEMHVGHTSGHSLFLSAEK